MTTFNAILAAIEHEYAHAKGKTSKFDRSQLPATTFYLEKEPPNYLEKLRENDLHSILHKIFSIPIIGPFVNTLTIMCRLSHHLHKLRAEMFELRMELQKIETNFFNDHRDFMSITRSSIENIEKRLNELEGK